MSKLVGAGGTPGGIGHFFGGIGLCGIGLYLLFSRVVVEAGYWFHGAFGDSFGHGGSIAVVLMPFVIGVAILFANGRSMTGWVFLGLGLLLLVVEIVTSLRIHFRPTSLPAVLGMFVMMAGGVGLVIRSLKSQ